MFSCVQKTFRLGQVKVKSTVFKMSDIVKFLDFVVLPLNKNCLVRVKSINSKPNLP